MSLKCRKRHRPVFDAMIWSGNPEDIDPVLSWGFPKLKYIGQKLIQLGDALTSSHNPKCIVRPGYYLVKELNEIKILEPAEFMKEYEILEEQT